MTTDNTTPDNARDVALALLRDGEATVSEAAHLLGVDRQLVHYWSKTAGVDAKAARNRHLIKALRRVRRKRG